MKGDQIDEFASDSTLDGLVKKFRRNKISRREFLQGLAASGIALGTLGTSMTGDVARAASNWSLEDAARPYEGTTIKAMMLPRPGYDAAKELIPKFEEKTGIEVTWETIPYENVHKKHVLDFTSRTGEFDVVLTDVVWIGEFASNGWIVPLQNFMNDEKLANPNLNLDGFIDVLLTSFGQWGGKTYGLPFDNYSGLMFYNKKMLRDAGFDRPPRTWKELRDEYGPALTDDDAGQYAFALQSRRGETQSADSFMRMVWPFGGKLLDPDTFQSVINEGGAVDGIQFRQSLMDYMPPDIVEWDHKETVQGLAQGNVAMITEWSAFYDSLVDPEQSNIADHLGVAPEPAGPAGRVPALGGFSLAVNSFSSTKKQEAAWLYIQWITSERMADDYIRAGGVPARKSVYQKDAIQQDYPHFETMLKSWQETIPHFRPRFPEWPAISEIIAQWGTQIMLGDVSVQQGLDRIDTRTEEILRNAGYYEGNRPLLQ